MQNSQRPALDLGAQNPPKAVEGQSWSRGALSTAGVTPSPAPGQFQVLQNLTQVAAVLGSPADAVVLHQLFKQLLFIQEFKGFYSVGIKEKSGFELNSHRIFTELFPLYGSGNYGQKGSDPSRE